MKKSIIISIVLCLMLSFSTQAQVFLIERGNTSLTFDNIQSAVDALQDGDKFYLPPGDFSLSGYSWGGYDGNSNHSNTICINKKVSVYGGGYINGANTTAITSGTFIMGRDASGSFITGIRFDGTLELNNISNCTVSRCKGSLYLQGEGSENLITECELASTRNGTTGYAYRGANLACIFTKCIFTGNTFFKNSIAYNCIFLNTNFNFSYCTFSYNIFVLSTTGTTQSLTFTSTWEHTAFTKNLWVGGYPSTTETGTVTIGDEITREPYANVFVDPSNGNYRLKDICSGKNAGIDDTDLGIYGTLNPFKEDKLPVIPNFSFKSISTTTDATGKLPVRIIVDAQDN